MALESEPFYFSIFTHKYNLNNHHSFPNIPNVDQINPVTQTRQNIALSHLFIGEIEAILLSSANGKSVRTLLSIHGVDIILANFLPGLSNMVHVVYLRLANDQSELQIMLEKTV